MNIDTSKKLKPFIEKEWLKKLQPFLDSKEMTDILTYLTIRKNSGKTIYPEQRNIFNAFKYTPWDKVKVVILGQDPYHTAGIADGLAFSSGNPLTCPPSLKNILKEVEKDVYEGLNLNTTSDYSLKRWAEQGVLLLNTALTVELSDAGVHTGIWIKFILNTLKLLNDEKHCLVFLLWGKKAQFYKTYIDESKHYVLEAAHPSPLAGGQFFGCKHFSKTNLVLDANQKEKITW